MPSMPDNRVHEYKSLLLLATVLAAACAGGGAALWRDGRADIPPANEIRKLDDGTMLVQGGGAMVRIREFSSGLILVNRFVAPEDDELLRNVRKALRDDAAAGKYGLSAFQKAQVRDLNLQTPWTPSSLQRETIANAWRSYQAAAKAATLPASAPATQAAQRELRKANVEKQLFAEVAALDGDERPLSVKIAHLRQIVSAQQFDLLLGKEPPATPTQPATTRK